MERGLTVEEDDISVLKVALNSLTDLRIGGSMGRLDTGWTKGGKGSRLSLPKYWRMKRKP